MLRAPERANYIRGGCGKGAGWCVERFSWTPRGDGGGLVGWGAQGRQKPRGLCMALSQRLTSGRYLSLLFLPGAVRIRMSM